VSFFSIRLKPVCETRRTLADIYQTTSESYAITLDRITTEIGRVPAAQYDNLIDECDLQKELSDFARTVLEEHLASHGC
jgi:hypothetical protein